MLAYHRSQRSAIEYGGDVRAKVIARLSYRQDGLLLSLCDVEQCLPRIRVDSPVVYAEHGVYRPTGVRGHTLLAILAFPVRISRILDPLVS